MSKLINLNYAVHSVRIELVNNEPWFCLADICEILGLSHITETQKRLAEDGCSKIAVPVKQSVTGVQEMWFINEPNLYRVIFRSNKAEATKFQDWVFNEVLPTIRKTGSYSAVPERTIINELMNAELRQQMNNIVRYFRNSSNQVASNLWNIIKQQLHIQRIADMDKNDYPSVVEWLKQFQQTAYKNYMRECDVENQIIKSAASIRLDNLQEFNTIQRKVEKNAKVLTLL